MSRIYLDNAATSWPKPPAVYDAVDRYQREIGAAAGRGAYAAAVQADAMVNRVRKGISHRIGAGDTGHVILTPGGTEALNLALHGFVQPGDHVVTTVAEHNSVLRPLAWLRDHAEVTLTVVGCDAHGYVDPDEIRSAIQPETRLVAVTHASNVTGAVQPIEAIGRIARDRECRLLVDAAQTVGRVPIDVLRLGVDLLAAPGHKQLLGPLGTGFLWIAPGIERRLQPLVQGGTGSHSESDRQPDAAPDRYESGNLNTPALAGLDAALAAGIDWADNAATAMLWDALASIKGVKLIGPPPGSPRVEVVSLQIDGYDPQEAAAVLASQAVECRAGLHCAGRMHQALGTAESGGAVRLSPGWATTPDQIKQAARLIETLAAHAPL